MRLVFKLGVGHPMEPQTPETAMTEFKLYSAPLSMFGAKVEITAHEKEIKFDLVMVPFDFERGYSPKHPEVLRVNPKRQVPVIVDDDVQLFDWMNQLLRGL